VCTARQGPLSVIELPGQYVGDRPPQPSTHITIDGVASQILMMPSLRMPKRVTLLGSDQREYRYLAKGGEDLRLDQRVQILFSAMSAQHKRTPHATARCGRTPYTAHCGGG
jgi:DNA-dependent protein kinase catalytic subunit